MLAPVCVEAQLLKSPLLELTADPYFAPFDVSIRSGKVTNSNEPWNYTAYVTSNGPSRVYQFSGIYGTGYGSVGWWDHNFTGYLTGIAVDASRKRVYVLEQEWGTADTDLLVFDLTGNLLYRIDSNHFDARGVDVDQWGNVYVTDRRYNMVLMYNDHILSDYNYTNGETVPVPGLEVVAGGSFKDGLIRDVACPLGGAYCHTLYSSGNSGLGRYEVTNWGLPISNQYFWEPHGIDVDKFNAWFTSQNSMIKGSWSSSSQIPQMTINYLFAFTNQIPNANAGNGCEVVPYYPGFKLIFICDGNAGSVKIFLD